MTQTSEPYATARREAIRGHQAASPRRLRRPEFTRHVETDSKTVAQVADAIAGSAGLAIAPSTDGPVRSWLHRYATTARHIHWGG